jgi:DNA-binding IclR family transcriptional regulator
VLDKAVALLAAIDAQPRSLAELQTATGLPRATAHRLATALEGHGLVRRNGDGRFTLGLRLIGLGRAAGDAFPLRDAARPVLERLAAHTGESVQLFVRQGDLRVCVDAVESAHGLRWIVPVGAVLPLDRGSAGRLLGGSITAEPWVESVEEREAGVCSVSAPVIDANGRIVAAVSVSGPVERLSRQPGERYGTAVEAAARAIETAAGPR